MTAPADSGDELARIVFVCTGNRARSALAAALLRRRAEHLPVLVESRGTSNVGAAPVLPEMLRAGAALELDLSDMRPIFESIRTVLYTYIEGAFNTEGALTRSGKWAPLSESYRRRYPDRPILDRTGALKRSLTSANATGSRTVITKTSLTIGTTIPYGIYHQSTEPRTKLPRRAPIDLTTEQEQEIARLLNLYLGRRAKSAGWLVTDVSGETI
jgi:phage gpG-like protein